jgi:uncharacterized oxidoreductase
MGHLLQVDEDDLGGEKPMQMTGNTIFITGGSSGIGRALAEALHAKGNEVIISGRRVGHLKEVAEANPGMSWVELDVTDPENIQAVAAKLIAEHPKLNVVINNSGIMKMDSADGEMDDAVVTDIVTTNLLGPIRVTSALIEHLKQQPHAAVIHMTSGLAFTPLAMTATYCATKAALHSYAMSQRFKLQGTSVKVLEIAPPWVQTELMGPQQANEPRAMPLKAFIEETMEELATDKDEVLTKTVGMLRNNPGPKEWEFVQKFNAMMSGGH